MSCNLVDVLIPPLQQPLTYALGESMGNIDVGFRVLVPLGRRSVFGFVISKHDQAQSIDRTDQTDTTLQPRWFQPSLTPELDLENSSDTPEFKSVISEVEEHPCFLPRQLEFFERVAQYYGVPLSNVLDSAVPTSVPKKFKRMVQFIRDPASTLKGVRQKQILQLIKTSGSPISISEITMRFKGAAPFLRKMEEVGVIAISSEEIIDQHLEQNDQAKWAKTSVSLSSLQAKTTERVISASNANKFQTFLLHGVTGSGKTEIYIESIKEVVAQGRGALVIVPEIALTPQLIDRFRARLGDQIAVLHSALSKNVRWSSWRALIEKRNFIAIGARSAIFAPVHNLGIIVVDEEHDSSYKQAEGLRYNARDLAILRGQFENCPVVLGSATPSLDSYYKARTKVFSYVSLPTRHAATPRLAIEAVDLRTIRSKEMPSKHVTPQLYEALQETISEGNQAFILYNRRGFSSYLQCEECGKVCECPNCSVTLTFHKGRNMLVCHYCGIHIVPPQCCSACPPSKDQIAPAALAHRGAGTEKIFDELTELFPGVVIDRLDRDVVDDLQSYREILDRVRSGKTSILVGTQMIAKGHDLPGVTLVGIADCDVGLHLPDFRASERVFQILTQAAGRAGRAEKAGRVILQSRVPEHISLASTLAQDYEAFAKHELKIRHDLKYPPFSRLLRVVASSEDKNLPAQILKQFRAALSEFNLSHNLSIQILGPAPATLERLKGKWRVHLLLKSESATGLIKAMNFLRAHKVKEKDLHLIFDMDPQDML